jgi:hypothetical protein
MLLFDSKRRFRLRRLFTVNIKIMEELDIFNLDNKILKSRSQWKYEYQVQKMEDRQVLKKILTYSPKRKTKHRTPTICTEVPAVDGTDHAWPNL